mmetsp:Transcript_52519/g.170609  ORF Transcript_52519/g.170609 Transcript_52519/m.170609 type:complete len:209 (-) Transcript_52519:100-726(-)
MRRCIRRLRWGCCRRLKQRCFPWGDVEDGVLLAREDIYGRDDYLFKVTFVGDSGVGKTSLMLSYMGEVWGGSEPTLGIDFRVAHRVQAGDGKTAKLQLWDVSGHDRFRDLATLYLRGHDGIVLVFDLTSEASFESLRSRWTAAVEANTRQDAIRLLVGTKVDLSATAAKAKVAAVAVHFAAERGMRYVETCAADRAGVSALIEGSLQR